MAFVALAALGLWLLQPILGNSVPLTVFLAAVMASAWIGGAGPGLLATLVSLIVAHALSLKPRATLPVTPAGYTVRMALFALAGCAISIVNEQRLRAGSAAAKKSEQQRAELVRSQARFRQIVETAQEGIWHIDAVGETVYVNQHLADMLGYRTEELVGRSAYEFVPEEDAAAAREAWSRPMGGKPDRTELRFRHHDGRVVWLRAAATPLIEDGTFAGAFAMLRAGRRASSRPSRARRRSRPASDCPGASGPRSKGSGSPTSSKTPISRERRPRWNRACAARSPSR